MKPIVFCKPTQKGVHTFFVKTDDGVKYLFTQSYRRGVHDFFSKGVSVNQVFNDVCMYDTALCKTTKKLYSYLQYIEKEYEVDVLNTNTRKHNHLKTKIKTKCQSWDDAWDDYIVDFNYVA